MRKPYLLHHVLFEAAAQAPDRCAVECQGVRLTYAALVERAQGIAALLQSLGVRRGDLVGVCLSKSVDAIATWFGVLLTGAAYVPMDAASPAPRLHAILAHGRVRVLVCDLLRKELALSAPESLAAIVWDRPGPGPGPDDDGRPSLAGVSGVPKPVAGADIDLAYVYFTSGSTGRPKGVMIPHRASRSYLESSDAILRTRPDDVIANHAPLAFDLASFDVHLAVKARATVSLIAESTTLLPGSFLKYFEAQKPTLMYTVPTTLNRLAALPSIARVSVPSLRGLLFAGEPPNVAALRTLRNVFPNASFHHWYGSTEAALVTAIAFPPGAELPDPLPIGTAIDNVDLALLDEEGRRKPIGPGETGELLVAGTLLLDGYVNEEQLTNDSFLVERTAAGLPVRWFRTKDMVRCAEGGTLYHMGRNDHVVKVKGLRVDLGEIESVLLRGEGVHECAVVSVPDPATGVRVHAFVVAAAGDPGALRRFVGTHLPAHMIPEQVHLAETLPRTASGKIDRKALSATVSATVSASR